MLKDKAEARISPLVKVKSVDTCYFQHNIEADSSSISHSQPCELHLQNGMIHVNRDRHREINNLNFIGQISTQKHSIFRFLEVN